MHDHPSHCRHGGASLNDVAATVTLHGRNLPGVGLRLTDGWRCPILLPLLQAEPLGAFQRVPDRLFAATRTSLDSAACAV